MVAAGAERRVEARRAGPDAVACHACRCAVPFDADVVEGGGGLGRHAPVEPWNDMGEVANSPTATVAGSPARRVVPIWIQVVPLVES